MCALGLRGPASEKNLRDASGVGKNSSALWTATRRNFVPIIVQPDPSLVPRRRRAPAPSPASLQETIVLDTTANQEIVDITDRVREIVRRAPAQSGVVTVTSQHTTCAVCVNENEHFLKSDILEYLNGAVPSGAARYKHNDLGSRPATARDRQAIEDNDCGGFGSVEAFMAQEPINAHAHLQAILVGNSVSCGVRAGGELGLGSWQSVLFVELDGPRAGRKVDVVVVF